jgi:hypothetical protein
MCTQLTYEGMIDEFIGIKNCKPRLIPRGTTDILANVEIDPALLDPAQAPSASMPTAPKKRKHHLTASKDMLFGDIRDLNFAVVGTRLSKLARRLEGDYGGAKNLKSVSQMKEFVGKLGGLQSEQQNLRLRELTTCSACRTDQSDTGLTEQLMPITRTEEFGKNLEAQQNLVAGYDANAQLTVLEDLMAQQVPWQSVLRSVVLMSLTSGGIKIKNLEAFKRDFLQVSPRRISLFLHS